LKQQTVQTAETIQTGILQAVPIHGTGTTSTDWFTKTNWSPASLPGKGTNVIIPAVSTHYPLLTKAVTVGTAGTITVNASASMDCAGNQVTAKTVTNGGTIRLTGAETLSSITSKTNGSGSTIEYYGTAMSVTSAPWGTEYDKISFPAGAAGVISSELNASGAVTIAAGTGKDLTLNSAVNTFTGGVTVTSGGAVVLNNDTVFTLADGAACDSLQTDGPVNLAGSVTTTDAQTYNNTVTLGADATLTGTTVTTKDTVTGGAHSLTVTGNAVFGDGTTDTLTGLTTLFVSGTTALNTTNITTTGNQTYAGAVTVQTAAATAYLIANSTGTSAGTAALVTFSDTISGNPATASLAIGGMISTDAKSNAYFGGTVSSFAGLYVNGTSAVHTLSVATTGPQNYLGAVSLYVTPAFSTTTDAGDITFAAAVTDGAAGSGMSFNLTGSSTGGTASFTGTSSSGIAIGSTTFGSVTISNGTVAFNDYASFTQSTASSFTIDSGTVTVGSNTFVCGNLAVNGTSKFTQTGNNDTGSHTQSFQTMSSESGTTVVWGAGCTYDHGGSLVFNGSVTGTGASSIDYNFKNITIHADLTISGVFFDLTIPAGITVTNGSFIRVRRNFTVDGTYVPAANTLTLGRNGTSSSETGYGGTISGSAASPSLGPVIIYQGTASKTFLFTNALTVTSLAMSDTTASGGAVTFKNDLTAETITNAASTVFAVSFNKNTTVTNAAVFNTTGTVTLGNDTSDTLTFTGGVTHTAGTTVLACTLSTTAGNVSCAAAVLTADTVITTGGTAAGGAVSFSGTVTNEAAHALSVSAGAADVTFGGAVGSGTSLASLTVTTTGTAKVNGGSIATAGSQTYTGSLSGTSAVTLTAGTGVRAVYTGTAAGTWTASGGIALSGTDFYLDNTGGSTFNLDCNLSCRNFYFYRGTLDMTGVTVTTAADFAAWGSAYSADDPDYTGADTRFACYHTTVPDYLPGSASYDSGTHVITFRAAGEHTAVFASGGGTLNIGGDSGTSGNFYVNGTNLTNFTIKIPDNASSQPAFNPKAAVTASQWGNPYAAVFNLTVTDSTVTAHTGGTYTPYAAGSSTSTDNGTHYGQKVTYSGTCSGWTSTRPYITEAHTAYDDVIHVTFSQAVENSNGEITSAIENATYSSGAQAFAGAYADADCTTALSGDVSSFYIKAAGTKWNTDAGYVYNSSTSTWSLSSGAADSTDRSGIHESVTPDITMLEGIVYAADGKTMSLNYGTQTDTAASSTYPVYARVYDECAPVLVDVFTGQELHTEYVPATGASSQPYYDSHNFIELHYSEPVDIGDLPAVSADTVSYTDELNKQVSGTYGTTASHGGAIANGTTGITAAGLVSTTGGTVTAGSAGTASTTVHALYRYYPEYAGAASAVHQNRIRISIAGYVSGDVTVGSYTYRSWPGYLDAAETPSGTAVSITNDGIRDLAKKLDGANATANPQTLDADGTEENHKLPGITVNTAHDSTLFASAAETTLYSSWDASAPVFAPYRNPSKSWYGSFTDYEVLGTAQSGATTIDSIEFHVFDNTPSYTSGDSYSWFSRKGWYTGTTSSGTLQEDAPDKFGGSRPYTGKANQTAGGIRYCSVANAIGSFTYSLASEGTDPYRSFGTGTIDTFVRDSETRSASSSKDGWAYIFPSMSASATRKVSECDTREKLYFAVPISTSYVLKTTFDIKYDADKAYITDLAGNRLKTVTVQSLDVSPPSFNMTVAPIGTDQLYVFFTKTINTDSLTWYENGTGTQSSLDALSYIPKSLKIVDSSDTVSSSISVDTSTAAKVVYSGSAATGLVFKLNGKVSLSDVTGLYLAIKSTGTLSRDAYGIDDSDVTYLQDTTGNYMVTDSAHALSDFAVNAVQPKYAYDNSNSDDTGLGSSYGNVYGTGDSGWAVHDWDADQQNYGTLFSGHDIFIYAKLYDGTDNNTGGLASGYSYYLYSDNEPDSDSVSTRYNSNTDGNWRIWLPAVAVSGSTPVYKNLAPVNNTHAIPFTSPVFPDASDLNTVTFTLPAAADSAYSSWKAGDQITFMFGITDSSGNPVTIIHAPVLTGGTFTGVSYPLYALRLQDTSDPTSLDLWSFKLKDITKQRGGVTILNNVINASVGEKTIVQVDMPSAGTLNVIVMTLDGNIVTYLQHGRAAKGTHYYSWNGQNNAGDKVARGLYFVRVTGSGIDETRKVMVVKE
jgi:hypothetical protein